MIETEFTPGLITLRMVGTVSDEDWDRVALDFEQAMGASFGVHLRLPESGALFVLMDWEKLEGWQQGARTCLHAVLHGLPGSRSPNSDYRGRQMERRRRTSHRYL